MAIKYVDKADVFAIISTSLNVYPAAGLLHYVPKAAEVHFILSTAPWNNPSAWSDKLV